MAEMFRAHYFVPVNPIPWKTPPYYPARVGKKLVVKAGRNEEAAAFTDAVRESLTSQGATMLPGYSPKVHFIFWRRRDQYKDSIGRTRTKNEVDSTNMQKLTEDACQGILYENDKHNVMVTSQIASQSIDTAPGILILCETHDLAGHLGNVPTIWMPDGFDREAILKEVVEKRTTVHDIEKALNVWPPRS